MKNCPYCAEEIFISAIIIFNLSQKVVPPALTPLNLRPKKGGMAAMEIKHVAGIGIIIVCISVAYYFMFALPKQNESRIALEAQKIEMEKQKIEREQKEKQAQENQKIEAQKQRAYQLYECRNAATERSNNYLRLNGTPVPGKPEVYNAPRYVHDEVAKILQRGLEDCERLYGNLH